MNAVKPLTVLGGELEATQANFPALQHFFKFDEAAGATTITDSINSVVITPDTALTVDGTKATVLTTSANLALTSGSWAAVGDKEPLIMIMGTYTIAGTYEISIGNTGSGSRMRATDSLIAMHDGTTALSDAVNIPADGTDAILYFGLDKSEAAAGIIKGRSNSAGQTAATSAGDGTSLTTFAATASNVSIDGFTNVYGIAVFYFDTLPTDLASATLWMRNEWAAGNKVIYPGWKDRS